jgi:hypothetical protein
MDSRSPKPSARSCRCNSFPIPMISSAPTSCWPAGPTIAR